MPNDKIQEALKELAKFDPTEALEVLDSLEKKRREQQFIKYWLPTEHEEIIFQNFKADKKIIGVLGGNRSGKSEGGAAIATA